MNNLDRLNTGEYRDYPQAPEEELINKMLPKEILQEIFYHLEDIDLQKVASSTKGWNIHSTDLAKTKEFAKIEKIASFLTENLQKKDANDTKIDFRQIFKDKIFNAKNLLGLKLSVDENTKFIFNELKKLNEEELQDLKNTLLQENLDENQQVFVQDLLELAEYNAELNIPNALFPNGISPAFQETMLAEKLKELARDGQIEKAIKFATILSSDKIFDSLSQTLIQKAKIHEALNMAAMISNKTLKSQVFSLVYMALTKSDNIDQIFKILAKMPDNYEKNCVIVGVCRELANKQQLHKAIDLDILSMVTEPDIKNFISSKWLAEQGKIEEAVKTAGQMVNQKGKDACLLEIVETIAKNGQVDESVKIIVSINDEEIKQTAFKIIEKVKSERSGNN